MKPGSLQHITNEVFYEEFFKDSNLTFSYLLQSQHTYFIAHSSWLLMKSEERFMANIDQKKISDINVKHQRSHYICVPLQIFELFFIVQLEQLAIYN